jgi:hypothetical protein
MIGLAATNVVGEVDITRLVRRQVRRRTCPPLHRYRTARMVPRSSSPCLAVCLETKPGEDHRLVRREGQAGPSADSEAGGGRRLQPPEHRIEEVQIRGGERRLRGPRPGQDRRPSCGRDHGVNG